MTLLFSACGRTPAAPAATATEAAGEADATVTAAVSEAEATATEAIQEADATATQEAAPTITPSAATPDRATATDDTQRTNLIRASDLLGYRVYDQQDEELGTVHDMIVGQRNEDLAYAVLSVGGFLGIGDKLHLVPWWAFTFDQTDSRLFLSVDPQVLKDAPTYSPDELPNVVDPNWDADILLFWEAIDIAPAATSTIASTESVTETTGITETQNVTETASTTDTDSTTETAEITAGVAVASSGPSSVVSLNDLMDYMVYSVKDEQGEDLGYIEDIMINPQRGRIEYMILSFGGFLGIGDKWFAIPLDATEVQMEKQTIVLDVTPDLLKAAPGFDKDELPNTADANWDQEIRDYWQQHQKQ